jgi:hypothetical protein
MMKKLNVVIITMLMCLTAIVLTPIESNVEATSELDYDFIYNITYNLSRTIYDAPLDYGLAKGRYFASEGERFAANESIRSEMINLGLYDPTPNKNLPYLDQIQNINEFNNWFKYIVPFIDLDTNLKSHVKTLAKGLKFNSSNNTDNIDCYFKYRINDSYRIPDYDMNLLTNNFSYTGVKLIRSNKVNISNSTNFINYVYEEVLKNYEIESGNFSEFIRSKFEKYYNFIFKNITPSDNSTFPSFVDNDINTSQGYFVILEENPNFNPKYYNISNANGSYEFTKEELWEKILDILSDLFGIVIDIFQKGETIWKRDIIWERIVEEVEYNEETAWKTCYNSSYLGRIRFDYTNESHDGVAKGTPIHVIFINGSDGKILNNSIDEYRVDFYINQKWDTSAVSYNVIGQINGTDPSKTVIIGSLYDSMWCQGTADSAIGDSFGFNKKVSDRSVSLLLLLTAIELTVDKMKSRMIPIVILFFI